MTHKTYIPATLLRPFVRTYRIIECRDESVNRVLPGASVAMAFRFRGRISYLNDNAGSILPSAIVSGLRRSVRLIRYQEDAAAVVVLFTETGAAAFFGEPLHGLFEESVSLDHFIPKRHLLPVEEQLAEAGNNDQRIAIVERFLLSKLCEPAPDKLVSVAVDSIYARKGRVRIKELAGSLYISQDAFEKRFRKTVGASPKQFCSIVRMQSLIAERRETKSFSGIALEAGFFDQAHFIKDFRLFTGLTPTGFFRSASFW